MKMFYEQLKEYDVKFILSEVGDIKKKEEEFIIDTKKGKLQSRALILATGTERRKLNVHGERELTGKGVSYCVTCDGFFFKNKVTAVIGGSDCAATSALALADLAKKVYVFYRGQRLRCEDINSDRLKKRKNVEIIYNALPVEILGEKKVEGIRLNVNGKEKDYEINGVFIEVGAKPITEFSKELNLDVEEGYIEVDDEMKTSLKGVFAAGDITDYRLKQVVVASAQGAIAAKSAYEFLKK